MEHAAAHDSRQPVADDSGTVHGKLPLSTNQPTQVWVGKFTKSGQTISGFADNTNGPFYRGGVDWSPSSSEYGLFITFVLMSGVAEVDCANLLYSPVVNTTQLMSVPPAKKSYDFNVTFDTGEKHDPKIIVTPITMPDPDC